MRPSCERASQGLAAEVQAGGRRLDARVRILAWVHIVLGGLGLLLAASLLALVVASRDQVRPEVTESIAGMLFLLTGAYFLPSFAGGLALRRGKAWGRAVIWVESALLAPLVPIGTALAGLTVWALLPRGGLAKGDGGMAAFERMLARAQRPALIALAAIASLGAIIGLGYLFRDQIEHIDPRNPVVAIGSFIAGVAIVVVVGKQLGWAGGGPFIPPWERERLRRRAKREQERLAAEHKARLAKLALDPRTAKYVEDIERGEYWSDEQIAYDLDREARTTCRHLQPIEGAMRKAGLRVRLLVDGFATCDCIVNESALELPADGPVRYSASIEPHPRAYEDQPYAAFECGACHSSIRVCNQYNSWPGIAVFPKPD